MPVGVRRQLARYVARELRQPPLAGIIPLSTIAPAPRLDDEAVFLEFFEDALLRRGQANVQVLRHLANGVGNAPVIGTRTAIAHREFKIASPRVTVQAAPCWGRHDRVI